MIEFLNPYSLLILGTAFAMGVWLALRILVRILVIRRLKIGQFNDARRRVAIKSVNAVLNVLVVSAIIIIWSVDQKDILLLLSSVVTVLGVAFFAQWSHLSNITSGVIIFFNTSTKIGDHIKIIDKDFDIQGEIFDIGFMFVKIKTQQGEIISLPNNILLQKAIKTHHPEEGERPANHEEGSE